MSTKIEVRTASKVDVKSIVNIHKDAFEVFFLTSLGTDFLMFYYCIITVKTKKRNLFKY